MKTLHALCAFAMIAASACAMADDGSIRVDQQMNAARTVAMQHYNATHGNNQVAHQDTQSQQSVRDNRTEFEKQQG